MLRLKEIPIEWVKFTGVMGIAANAVLAWLCWHGVIGAAVSLAASAVAIAAVICAVLRPIWFRTFYRGGMTCSFLVGQTVGRIVLTLLFLMMVTPMGWLLRLCGKDLLQLRPQPAKASFWQPAKNSRAFDRMF
jgi:hypothetical protein